MLEKKRGSRDRTNPLAQEGVLARTNGDRGAELQTSACAADAGNAFCSGQYNSVRCNDVQPHGTFRVAEPSDCALCRKGHSDKRIANSIVGF